MSEFSIFVPMPSRAMEMSAAMTPYISSDISSMEGSFSTVSLRYMYFIRYMAGRRAAAPYMRATAKRGSVNSSIFAS